MEFGSFLLPRENFMLNSDHCGAEQDVKAMIMELAYSLVDAIRRLAGVRKVL
jgi:hypothetical protein